MVKTPDSVSGAEATPTVPQGRRERRRQESLQRLLDSAEDAFLRKGLDSTTVNEITDAADLGFGTFYGYFDSKDAIAVAVAERLAHRMVAELASAARGASDPAEALGAVLVAIARRDERDPRMIQFLLEAGTQAGVMERQFGPLLVQLIFDGMAQSRFDRKYAQHTPWALASLILGTLFYRQQSIDRTDFERALVYRVLRMLGADATEADAVAVRVTT